MFHEEKLISGILHHRGTPNGFWTPYTARRLSEMVMERDATIAKLTEELSRILPGEIITLEQLDGYVVRMDEKLSCVELRSRDNGDILYGEYSTEELKTKGIEEGNRFLCTTVKRGQWTRVEIEYVPPRMVTDEENRAIKEEIESAFPDDAMEVDY